MQGIEHYDESPLAQMMAEAGALLGGLTGVEIWLAQLRNEAPQLIPPPLPELPALRQELIEVMAELSRPWPNPARLPALSLTHDAWTSLITRVAAFAQQVEQLRQTDGGQN